MYILQIVWHDCWCCTAASNKEAEKTKNKTLDIVAAEVAGRLSPCSAVQYTAGHGRNKLWRNPIVNNKSNLRCRRTMATIRTKWSTYRSYSSYNSSSSSCLASSSSTIRRLHHLSFIMRQTKASEIARKLATTTTAPVTSTRLDTTTRVSY